MVRRPNQFLALNKSRFTTNLNKYFDLLRVYWILWLILRDCGINVKKCWNLRWFQKNCSKSKIRKNCPTGTVFSSRFKKTVQNQKYHGMVTKKLCQWDSFFITVLWYFWFWTVFLKQSEVSTFLFFRENLETLFTEIWWFHW